MGYEHTQQAPLGRILYGIGALMLGTALVLTETWPSFAFLVGATLVILVGAMFGSLNVRDEGDGLAIRYGPLPVFRARFPYDRIHQVERSRSSLIDGWGVHWVPGRGTTFNLWGRDCVTFRLGRRIIRIGSDDADNLTAFLKEKTGETTGGGAPDEEERSEERNGVR